jgi:hypothetical protein
VAASLREGLEETMTAMGLHLSEGLERVLSSTNLIENLFSRVPAHIEKNAIVDLSQPTTLLAPSRSSQNHEETTWKRPRMICQRKDSIWLQICSVSLC